MRIPIQCYLLFFITIVPILTPHPLVSQVITKKLLKAGLDEGSDLVERTGNSSTERTSDGRFVFKEYYYDTGVLTIYHSYADRELTVPHGPWRDYSDDGKLTNEGRFANGKREGEWKAYNLEAKTIRTVRYVNDMAEGLAVTLDAAGRKREEVSFEGGKRQGIGRTYNEDGTMKEETRYVDGIPEIAPGLSGEVAPEDILFPPLFPCHPQLAAAGLTDQALCAERSLMAFLSHNINYPAEMRENYVMGQAIATFVIDKDGLVKDIQVIHGVSNAIKNEVRRVLSGMPPWTPGRAGDHPVKVRYTLPVRFRLE